MKSILKGAAMLAVVINLSSSVTAQVTNDYIQNNTTQIQTANFSITGLGKLGNGIVLPKEGYDGVLLRLRFTNLAETKKLASK